MDLVVAPGPGVLHGLVVPADLLVERFSRSSGPGGQGVNTTDSRVEVEVWLDALDSLLTPAQQRRLRARLGANGVDRLTVTAQEHRQQRRNRLAARERLAEALAAALAPPPPPRRPTTPTKGAQERRLSTKRQRSQTKAGRARPLSPD